MKPLLTRKIKYASLALCLLLGACASKPPLFEGNPEISKLPANVRNSSIFKVAPLANVAVLTYESTELATAKKFSHYQIQLLESRGAITRYRTREVDPRVQNFMIVPGLPIIRGEGVGYGGIFMLAYEKNHFVTGQNFTPNDYYVKHLITSISNPQGHLFPLAVGNKLTFDYTDLNKSIRGGPAVADSSDNGKFVYEVLAHQSGFTESEVPVPGDVYLIRVSKTTREVPTLTPQYEYYFSTYLGWYIKARYYQHGKLVAVYRLMKWQQ